MAILVAKLEGPRTLLKRCLEGRQTHWTMPKPTASANVQYVRNVALLVPGGVPRGPFERDMLRQLRTAMSRVYALWAFLQSLLLV